MNKRLVKYLIPVTVIVITVTGIFISLSEKVKSDYRLDKFNLSKIPSINTADWSKQFKISPMPHLILQKKDTSLKKYVFSTADCGIVKHGYKNRVELFVVINHQGKIENVILGKNIETPKLIERMHENGFFQQWNSKNNPEIKYITGATYSCKAVNLGIAELRKLLKRKRFFK